MAGALVGLELRDDGVALVRFQDPDRLNAMTRAMGEALRDRVSELRASPEVRVVVLSGAGRAFSAGGDLSMIEGMARAGREQPGEPRRGEHRDAMVAFYHLFLSVRDLPVPTVAAVQGAAIGAGFAVALACDLRVVDQAARLGLNFVRLGIHPGMGSTWLLPRLAGPSRAADLLLTGRRLDGVEAGRLGLADRVVPGERVLDEAMALAAEIAAAAPLAVRGTKAALRRALATDLETQLGWEAEQQAVCYETDDLAEGLAAARERRPPRFRGA